MQRASPGTGVDGGINRIARIDNRLRVNGTPTTADGLSAFGFARYDRGNAAAGITPQPIPLTRCSGAPASLTIAASGTGPLTHQWQRNGTNVSTTTDPSAATATLRIAGTSGSTVGTRTRIVTSAGGCAAAVNNPVTLTAVTGTPPTVWLDPDPVETCRGLPADIANTDGDTVQTGGGPDGRVDNGDFTAFFNFFFQGCP